MTDRERLFEILRTVSYEERDVVLASGRRSTFYVDARNTSLHPEGNVLCGRELWRVLRAGGPAFAAVAGPSLGADPLVAAIVYTSFLDGAPIPGLLVRKEAKGYGTGRLLEGTRNVPPGSPIAVVEDVLTTGGSALRTAAAIREAGYVPVRVVVVVDREEGGREAVLAEGLPVDALYGRREFQPEAP